MNRLLTTLMFLTALQCALADGTGYSGYHEASATRGSLTVRHSHDWSSKKVHSLFQDLSHHEKFLTAANDFASTELRDGSTVLFKRPSPALTQVWISPDGQFVVGLSSVMLHNPYQLVIWKRDGTLLHREHIASEVAKLSSEQRREFARRFPKAEKFLAPRYFTVRGLLYLDYSILGVPNQIGTAAWEFLYPLRTPHPYSGDFSESVTNSVYWFHPKNPKIALLQKGTEFTLTLRSPTGKPMAISFKP
ncbi:MAG TPA: hypothetical protein VD994_21490 [Prosthecobacter sp.]|nr:hypothetical protein [Prosthecobacter sp.]